MNKLWEFSAVYLKKCSKMKPQDILTYLEDYKSTQVQSTIPLEKEQELLSKSILISIKIPEHLLKEFKMTCSKKGFRYQTQIKILMKEWLDKKL